MSRRPSRWRPPRRHASTGSARRAPPSSRLPRIKRSKQRAEIFQRRHVVRREEIVAVRERGGHASRQRLVAPRSEQRVEPDQPVRRAAQVYELGDEMLGIAAVPSVADYEDDRAVAEHTPGPLPVELAERIA